MAKAKTGLSGEVFVESRRKNLVKVMENTQNTPLPPVTRLEKGTEGKENDLSVSKETLF